MSCRTHSSVNELPYTQQRLICVSAAHWDMAVDIAMGSLLGRSYLDEVGDAGSIQGFSTWR